MTLHLKMFFARLLNLTLHKNDNKNIFSNKNQSVCEPRDWKREINFEKIEMPLIINYFVNFLRIFSKTTTNFNVLGGSQLKNHLSCLKQLLCASIDMGTTEKVRAIQVGNLYC